MLTRIYHIYETMREDLVKFYHLLRIHIMTKRKSKKVFWKTGIELETILKVLKCMYL